jgi:hypothetical protein
MCMEDVRIGRKSVVFRYRYTIPANGSVQVLLNRPDRIAMLIPSHGAAVTLGADTVDLGGVIEGTINLQQNNVRLSISQDGNLVTFPWYIMNSAGSSQVITVWETVLMEQ